MGAAESRESKEPSQPPITSQPAGKTYDTFNYPATPENVSSLPGANGPKAIKQQPTSAGLLDGLKSISLEEFKEVHKKPCTREGFLTGIGAGFGVGGIRAILGGKFAADPTMLPLCALTVTAPVYTACNWAVVAFAFGSFAMHEYCQRKRKMEKAGIQRINAALNEKKVEQEKKREEQRKARRQAKEEADRQKESR
ncbi:MAG: hypothetical protein LQ338_003309 [Usnochroma carphineum]|nr:MAG: hypothetical protein LQ338_003309 [Usnochroma carphineum]